MPPPCLISNGFGLFWLSCCWCPRQPPDKVQDAGDDELTTLRALASAKRAGWRIAHVAGRWQGLCPARQKRKCDFQQ